MLLNLRLLGLYGLLLVVHSVSVRRLRLRSGHGPYIWRAPQVLQQMAASSPGPHRAGPPTARRTRLRCVAYHSSLLPIAPVAFGQPAYRQATYVADRPGILV